MAQLLTTTSELSASLSQLPSGSTVAVVNVLLPQSDNDVFHIGHLYLFDSALEVGDFTLVNFFTSTIHHMVPSSGEPQTITRDSTFFRTKAEGALVDLNVDAGFINLDAMSVEYSDMTFGGSGDDQVSDLSTHPIKLWFDQNTDIQFTHENRSVLWNWILPYSQPQKSYNGMNPIFTITEEFGLNVVLVRGIQEIVKDMCYFGVGETSGVFGDQTLIGRGNTQKIVYVPPYHKTGHKKPERNENYTGRENDILTLVKETSTSTISGLVSDIETHIETIENNSVGYFLVNYETGATPTDSDLENGKVWFMVYAKCDMEYTAHRYSYFGEAVIINENRLIEKAKGTRNKTEVTKNRNSKATLDGIISRHIDPPLGLYEHAKATFKAEFNKVR